MYDRYYIIKEDFSGLSRRVSNGKFKAGDAVIVKDAISDGCKCVEVRPAYPDRVDGSYDYRSYRDYGTKEGFIQRFCSTREYIEAPEPTPEIEAPEMNHEYIKSVETRNTGGGILVDYITLKDGTMIGVSDEGVAVSAKWDANHEDSKVVWFKDLPESPLNVRKEAYRIVSELDDEMYKVLEDEGFEGLHDYMDANTLLPQDSRWEIESLNEVMDMVEEIAQANKMRGQNENL